MASCRWCLGGFNRGLAICSALVVGKWETPRRKGATTRQLLSGTLLPFWFGSFPTKTDQPFKGFPFLPALEAKPTTVARLNDSLRRSCSPLPPMSWRGTSFCPTRRPRGGMNSRPVGRSRFNQSAFPWWCFWDALSEHVELFQLV